MSAACDISERDLRRLLDVVSPDVTAAPGLELPEELLRGIAELIPCQSVNFFVMDTRRAEYVVAQELLFAYAPEDDDETDAMFFQAYWDCLACCNPELTGDRDQVTMWQDFYSERDFARLLMAEYSRRAGFWHELLVCLPPLDGRERRLMLTRTADDIPFSERDRLLLTLLRPHLIQIRDRVEAERRTVPALTRRQVELLRRVARGDTNRQLARDVGLSEGTVRKHLENIYARLEVHSRTEALSRAAPLLAG